MDASIVIRTKNEEEFIGETLERVRKQEFNGEYEIVIVDCGSTDSTLEIVEKYDVRLLKIPPREFTYGRSLNMGAKSAAGEFVVNLSAHALPSGKKWLTNLVSGFEDDKVAGVYGRQVSNGRLNPFEARRNEQFFGTVKITFAPFDRAVSQKLHFSNANSAVRREVWQRFNFNEQVRYAEDILWQSDVMRSGFSIVYVPNSIVYHTHKLNIRNAYKNSRKCAYELAQMTQKKRSIPSLGWDLGVFLLIVSTSMFYNLEYVFRNRYLASLKITPWYVIAEGLGWLGGRMDYRLAKNRSGGGSC